MKELEEVFGNLRKPPFLLNWSDFKELGFEGKLKERRGGAKKRLFLLEMERVAHKLTPLNDAVEEEAAAAIAGVMSPQEKAKI